MGLTLEDRKKGGRAVALLKGKEWMRKIGRRGRRKQLKAK